jgi:hypothetical protein
MTKDIIELMQDPRWAAVEKLIQDHINPLMDFNTIDLTQPAEHVKAEVIARKLAYNNLADFLNTTIMVSNKIEKKKNPFV